MAESLLQFPDNITDSTDEFVLSMKRQKNQLTVDFIATCDYYLQECLDEKQRRLGAGLFAELFDNVTFSHRITGLSRKTVRRGRKELSHRSEMNKIGKPVRQSGAGRPSKIERFEEEVLDFVKKYTAGDPMSTKKWMRVTLRTVADAMGNVLSHTSIGKILKQNDYSLLVNKKTRRTQDKHPKRESQFNFINSIIEQFQKKGIPVIAIDGKKNEYIGAFKQHGKTWSTLDDQHEVFDHDYSNYAEGKLVPFGIYDSARKEGYVVGGMNRETTEFAVDSLVIWWENHGSTVYPDVEEVCITCDAGKPNTYRGFLFKYLLQTKFVDKFGIKLHIMHYPPGDSKYHIIERELFSQISLNFSGNPLYTYDKAMSLIRNTSTRTGLEVKAVLHEKEYQLGIGGTLTDTDYEILDINRADINPEFNYTIEPRSKLNILLSLIDVESSQVEKQVKKFGRREFKSWDEGLENAKQLSIDNCWKYHEISDVILKGLEPKRVDGQRGRPGPDTEMYFEYYFHIKFTKSKSVLDYIDHLS